ncbi:F-box/LRR-repeat protein 12 [Parasteatoda tepidariorum]|nr:F-box/LRR-repeat protein 12 [Parasteatoda tepidariorum]
MDKIPDSILLDIFSRLDYSELCMCSRVCQRWRILSDDFTLKRIIVVKKPLQERFFLSLINNHFTNNLQEFHLLKPKYNSPMNPFSLVIVKKSCFWQISNKSPNLKKLILVSCSLPNVSISDLPPNIFHLSIRESELSPSTFFGSQPHLSLPNLTCLDLGGCNNFLTSQDLHILTTFKCLKALYFEGCFRINNGGIESLIEILPQLETLDVEGTDISNEGVHIILDNCAKIKELFIGHTLINDRALFKCQKDAVPKLSYICVRDTNISSIGLHAFLMPPYNPSITVKADFRCSSNCFKDPNCSHIDEVNNPSMRSCFHYMSHECSR